MTLDPKVEGAIRGLERLKADFHMQGTNATTIERAIQTLRDATAPSGQAPLEGVKALQKWADDPDIALTLEGSPRACERLQADIRSALLPASAEPVVADHVLIDGGRSYYLSTDAMSTMMAHGLLSSHHDGMLRLATEEALRNDPGSAGVNHNHPRAVLAIVRAALTASPPASGAVEAGWQDECATEGCSRAAAVYFIRGGVGSHYCDDCYMKIQALPAAPTEGR